MFPLAIPLAGILGSVLTSVVGNLISSETTSNTMREQAQINQQGIDTANRYNLPINQMQRLRDAGLNPNLVYGNGSVAGMTSSGQASTNQGYKQVPISLGVGDALDRYMQSKQINQNVEESRTRQQQMVQSMRESMARQLNQELDAGYKDQSMRYRIGIDKQRLDNLGAEFDNILADTGVKSATENNLQVMRNQIVAQTDYIADRTDLTRQQVITETTRRALMSRQMEELQTRCKLNNKQVELLAERILNVRQDTSNKSLWHELQELNRDSNQAFDKFLQDHENVALFVGILREVGRFFGYSAGKDGGISFGY